MKSISIFGRTLLAVIGAAFLFNCSSDKRNELPAIPTTAVPADYEGYHDFANCRDIMGWVWNKAAPNERVKVEIYDGSTKLTTITAEEFREDLVKAQKGDGKYSFRIAPPAALFDDMPHQISIKVAGTGYSLMNTPKALKCAPAPAQP